MKLPLAFGRVNEVKVTEKYVLMPLSPLDHRATHFFATIIYDLVKLGYEEKEFEHYFKDIREKNSLKNILAFVTDNGRMVWKDEGKTMPNKESVIKIVETK